MSFFDRFLGLIRPKKFKKEANRRITWNVLSQLQQYGRADWQSLNKIAEYIYLVDKDFFNDAKVQQWFRAVGFKGKICESTLKLRKRGHPIIAGRGRKGYRYADENCDDLAEVWNDRLNEWKNNEQNIEKQRKLDMKLLQDVIKKVQELEQKKKLLVVLRRYRQKGI